MTRRSTHDPKPLPAAEYLRECFIYDDAGFLLWKTRPEHHFATSRAMRAWNKQNPDTRAGSPMKNGYRLICIAGVKYLEHRIIYHMMVGPVTPTDFVDHRDHDHTNNRKGNFRLCPHAKNLMNQPGRHQKYGTPKHVHWSKREQKYKVILRADGKVHCIGTFASLAEAEAAAIEARRRLHGEFEYRGAA